MKKILRPLLLTVLILVFSSPALNAFYQDDTEGSKDVPIDVVGKVQDHNYLTVAGYEIPLPRIYWTESGWYFFLTPQQAVESGKFVEVEHSLVPAEETHILLDLSITSHLMYVWFGVGLTLWITFAMARRYRRGIGRETEPKGWFQNLFEITFVFVRDDITKTNIPDDKYEGYVPYIYGVFVSIFFMNIFGLFPWGTTATADITVTATLAAITFVITQWSGTKEHWEHVFWFPGVPAWVRLFLTPVEFIGLFTKPFALAVRLFANMLSGKIMIICVLGLIFIFAEYFGNLFGIGVSLVSVPLTVALYVLKAFVGLLQAYIFALLSAVFIGMAAESHEHEHAEAEHA
ncbi:MAG: F0F1 ATP synthase subunit A [Balneolaceae bacterium]|nr:F0F1 ATP synthase subunit A [Balneolaceae bacterium]